MTLIGVIIGQYGLQRRREKQQETEIESLTTALIAELRSADEILRRLLYAAHDIERTKKESYTWSEEKFEEAFENEMQFRLGIYRYTADQYWFSNSIFEGNTDKIGHLDEQAASAVVTSYNSLDNLRRSLQGLSHAIDHDDLYDSQNEDWPVGAELSADVFMYDEQITYTVTRTIIYQKIALNLLGDELQSSDKADVAFAYDNMEPRTQNEDQIQEFIKSAKDKLDVSSVDDLIEEFDIIKDPQQSTD